MIFTKSSASLPNPQHLYQILSIFTKSSAYRETTLLCAYLAKLKKASTLFSERVLYVCEVGGERVSHGGGNSTLYDSRAIANRILDIANQKNIRLTMMQLLKLVYISHGWWLTFSNGQALTEDRPQAWQYGPVHPKVYSAFRRNGSQIIEQKAIDSDTGFEFDADITPEVARVLDQVVESYGRIHAFQLSDMTHQSGTPWSKASKQWGNYAPMSDTIIKDHFDGLRRQRT